MTFVSELEPPILWKHFDRLLAIPRGSGKEEEARNYVLSVAATQGCEARRDAVGNVVVVKPATEGRDGAPATVLQSHLDMVNEKNADVEHDFATDPITPQRENGFLKATGTTLGADNGIGVAAMLAVLEDDTIRHGPVELLFTVEEETGLTGAAGLDPSIVTGRRLINLDSEDEGVLTVGCAGGADSELRLELDDEAVGSDAAALQVTIRGLKGGHSGVDIHLQRGNAVKLLTRTLSAARRDHAFRLAGLGGGNLRNAIPREAAALLVCGASAADAVGERLRQELAAIAAEYQPVEPDFDPLVETTAKPAEAWTAAATDRALALLDALPNGVMAMSYDIAGLVETSTNLATVSVVEGELRTYSSTRSSVAAALEATRGRIRSIARLAGARVREGKGYPGWKPNLDSQALQVLAGVMEEKLGRAPEVGAIHAGLECGILGEKIPGMDMISFGPTIRFPHSPDERVEIDTVGRFYEILTAALEELSS